MSTYGRNGGIFTGRFWKATAERAIRAFASTAAASGLVGAVNVSEVPWQGALLAGLLAAAAEVLISVSANQATGDGPGVTDAETVR